MQFGGLVIFLILCVMNSSNWKCLDFTNKKANKIVKI